MSAKPPSRIALRAISSNDDGAQESPSSLRWARDLWERSIVPERRRNSNQAGRAREQCADQSRARLAKMRDELGARLLVSDPETQAVRNLFIVHKELANDGWSSVEALPRQVTGRALAEAEMLDTEEPSTLLGEIVDELRALNALADARADDEAIQGEWGLPKMPEVSETNYEEYELMERSWIGTVPAGLQVPERER